MAAKIEEDMARICEHCKHIEDYDHIFRIDELKIGPEHLLILQELLFIEMNSEDTFRLSVKGKKHCEELEGRKVI